MESLWKVVVPLGLVALLIGYHRVADTMKIPKPVYWITMMAGGFLLMSIFDLW